MVEYLLEAKKFIEHARAAYSSEARNQDLDMAEWCISRAIEEAGHKPPQQAAKPTGKLIPVILVAGLMVSATPAFAAPQWVYDRCWNGGTGKTRTQIRRRGSLRCQLHS